MRLGAGRGLPFDVARCNNDVEGTFCAFFQRRAGEGVLVVVAVGVDEFGGAGAEDLETVVEVGAGREGLGAEAGAGVVDLDEGDGLGGVVGDDRLNVRGVAAGGCGEEADDAGDDRTRYGHVGLRFKVSGRLGWVGRVPIVGRIRPR